MSKLWANKVKVKQLRAHSNGSGIEPDFVYSFLIILYILGENTLAWMQQNIQLPKSYKNWGAMLKQSPHSPLH